MNGRKKTSVMLASLLVIIALLTSALAILFITKTFDTTVYIKAYGIKLYSDEACTTELTSIDLGSIYIGGVSQQNFWVKNIDETQDFDVCWQMVCDTVGYTLVADSTWKMDIKDNGEIIGQIWLARYISESALSWHSLDHETPFYVNMLSNDVLEVQLKIEMNTNTPQEGLTLAFTTDINAHDTP